MVKHGRTGNSPHFGIILDLSQRQGFAHVRRRRRRSAFSQRSGPDTRYALIGAVALILVGGFAYLMHQANVLAPQPKEIRIELPNAFKG